MKHRFRALLGGIALAGAMTAFPVPAEAAGFTTVVAFGTSLTATATVGAGAFATAPGGGLCVPGLEETGGACAPGGATPINGWSIAVPAADCTAVGTPAGPCAFALDGFVSGIIGGEHPHCGISEGTSRGGPGPDKVTLGGTPYDAFIQWVASAGGTLPITGYVSAGGHDHSLGGTVQARPIVGNCVTTAATGFLIVGSVVVHGQ